MALPATPQLLYSTSSPTGEDTTEHETALFFSFGLCFVVFLLLWNALRTSRNEIVSIQQEINDIDKVLSGENTEVFHGMRAIEYRKSPRRRRVPEFGSVKIKNPTYESIEDNAFGIEGPSPTIL